jgi:hypothetical protein
MQFIPWSSKSTVRVQANFDITKQGFSFGDKSPAAPSILSQSYAVEHGELSDHRFVASKGEQSTGFALQLSFRLCHETGGLLVCPYASASTGTCMIKASERHKIYNIRSALSRPTTMKKGNNGVHTNEQVEMKIQTYQTSNMSVSMKPKRAALNLLKETTDLVLADLERDSKFFKDNPSMPLPEFDKTGKWRYRLHKSRRT